MTKHSKAFRFTILLSALLILCSCWMGCPRPKDHRSALGKIKLSAGMKRADVEALAAKATGAEPSYTAYNGAAAIEEADLQAVYQDGVNQLTVNYNHGTPAPWARPADGGPAQHYEPIDQSVKSWTLNKIN
jgi:hypothetical protein